MGKEEVRAKVREFLKEYKGGEPSELIRILKEEIKKNEIKKEL
jgi:hypothetical protein